MANSSQARTGLGRTLAVCAILFVILVFAFLISSIFGSQRLPIAATLCALTGKSGCALSGEERAILLDIRIPRLLLAGAGGGFFAAAGGGPPGTPPQSPPRPPPPGGFQVPGPVAADRLWFFSC